MNVPFAICGSSESHVDEMQDHLGVIWRNAFQLSWQGDVVSGLVGVSCGVTVFSESGAGMRGL